MIPELSQTLQVPLLQAIGVLPLALLSFLLSRSVRRDYLRYWWQAWASLAAALVGLLLARSVPSGRGPFEPLYYLGEYLYAGLMVAGCRSFAGGAATTRRARLLILPAAVLAVAVTFAHAEFAVRFIPHAAVMAVLFSLALREARRLPAEGKGRIGARLLQVSLLALVLSSIHYVPMLSWAAWSGQPLPATYSSSTAVFDLLSQTLLGFGTLIAVMERQNQELEASNEELRAAREKLEQLAHLDPLTSSFNRRAFDSMLSAGRTGESTAGCVVLADLDGLKVVNDTFGHAAGDAAISAVARAIRQLVRAGDPVFRWGGDEFLVLLFGVSEEDVERRLDGLAELLRAVTLPGAPAPQRIAVSFGVAAFDSLDGLERALEAADERMYRQKQAKGR